jgi:hypothetical protein
VAVTRGLEKVLVTLFILAVMAGTVYVVLSEAIPMWGKIRNALQPPAAAKADN